MLEHMKSHARYLQSDHSQNYIHAHTLLLIIIIIPLARHHTAAHIMYIETTNHTKQTLVVNCLGVVLPGY